MADGATHKMKRSYLKQNAVLLAGLSAIHTACLVAPDGNETGCNEAECAATASTGSGTGSASSSSESGNTTVSGPGTGATSTTTDASGSTGPTDTTDTTDTTGSDLPDPPVGMVLVPAGGYWYGCNPETDIGCYEGTFELEYVEAEAIFADIYETTVDAYLPCIDAGACGRSGLGAFCNEQIEGHQNHPINCITYEDAENYCHWAGKRLPTEREWVRMARGPESKVAYPWGNRPEPDCEHVIVSGFNNVGCDLGHTWPVGERPQGASSLGIHNLLGNVREWTSDDATASLPGSKSIRGQHYRTNTSIVPAIYRRDADQPDNRSSWTGFRCVQDITAPHLLR